LLKVVQDCIEQICGHLGVQNSLEQYEFAIYYVVEAGKYFPFKSAKPNLIKFLDYILFIGNLLEKAARPLNRCEYIFDVITELTKLNNEFYLIFKRILWYFPLRLESDPYIDMMYNQILPDYVEGLVVVTNSNNKLSSHLNVSFRTLFRIDSYH
jgi:myosin XV